MEIVGRIRMKVMHVLGARVCECLWQRDRENGVTQVDDDVDGNQHLIESNWDETQFFFLSLHFVKKKRNFH